MSNENFEMTIGSGSWKGLVTLAEVASVQWWGERLIEFERMVEKKMGQ